MVQRATRFYRMTVSARREPGGPFVATETREIRVALQPTVPEEQDNDTDQLPDWWEIQYGISISDDGTPPGDANAGQGGDPDNDGVSNLTEFLLGLDPNEANFGEVPLLELRRNYDGSISFFIDGIPDRNYTISWSSDLENWEQLGEVIDTSGDVLPRTIEVVDQEDPERVFYRLSVSLP